MRRGRPSGWLLDYLEETAIIVDVVIAEQPVVVVEADRPATFRIMATRLVAV